MRDALARGRALAQHRRRPCPRRRAGSSAAASTGRRSRTPRPWATCQGWIGVTRTGSKSSPRLRPASSAKRDRHVRRAERGRAELAGVRRRAARRRPRSRSRRRLALVGAGADGRVALDVLDRRAARRRAARRRSATVASRSRSTNVDRPRRRRAAGTAERPAGLRPSARRRTRPRAARRRAPGRRSARPTGAGRRAWLQRWTRGLQPPDTARRRPGLP